VRDSVVSSFASNLVFLPPHFCILIALVSPDDRYNAKFANNASYQRYKNGTSLIIPWFPAPPADADASAVHQNDIASAAPYVPWSF
jgi:hypothetical protein